MNFYIDHVIKKVVSMIFKVVVTDVAGSKFFRSLVHMKNFGLIWQLVFKLGYLFFQGR